jgi:hypothetical protein
VTLSDVTESEVCVCGSGSPRIVRERERQRLGREEVTVDHGDREGVD